MTQLSDGASVVSNKKLWPGQRALNVMSVTGPGSHMYAIQSLDTGTAITIRKGGSRYEIKISINTYILYLCVNLHISLSNICEM